MKLIIVCLILVIATPAIAASKPTWYTYNDSKKTCIQDGSPAEFIESVQILGVVKAVKDEFVANGKPLKVTITVSDGTTEFNLTYYREKEHCLAERRIKKEAYDTFMEKYK